MKTWLMRRPVRRPVSRGHDRAQQFVGVQAALHQQFGLALANQFDRLGGRGMAVRHVDDLQRCRGSIPAAFAISSILAAGPTRIGVISPCSPASMAPASADCFAGMRHCGRNRLEAFALHQQLFVFSRSGCGFIRSPQLPVTSLHEPPVRSLSAGNVRTIGQADAVQQAARTWSGSARAKPCAAPPETVSRTRPKTGPSSALKVKFRKLTTPVAVPLILRRVRFLDDGVGQHRGARRDAGNEAEDVGREDARAAIEDPGEAGQQQQGSANDHRLSAADAGRR